MTGTPLPELLWHYTCSHGAVGIDRDGAIRPHPHPYMHELGPVTWLTDVALPGLIDAEALGLQSTILSCDRIEFRYPVWTEHAHGVDWWGDVRDRVDSRTRVDLEHERQWRHWWIATEVIDLSRLEGAHP